MSETSTTKVTWVVAMAGKDGVGGQCLFCRAKLKIALPVRVNDWCAAMGAFVREHKNCTKPEAS